MFKNLLIIVAMLVIFDFIGYIVTNFLFKIKTRFNIVYGFITTLVIFQIMTIGFMKIHASFNWILYCILPLMLILLVILIIKYFKSYVLYAKEKYTNKNYFFYIFIGLLLSGIMIIFTVTEIDQILYSSLATSTIKSGIIYYNDGIRTILDTNIATAHGLESYSLFGAMIMKVFSVDILDYNFGIFRIIEGFVIVSLLASVNELYLKKNKLTFLLMVLGLLGLNILSSTMFSRDDEVLLFAGNIGTLLMFCLMGPLLSVYFKVQKNKILYFIIFIVLFSSVVTYSFFPIVLVVSLILSYVERNNSIFFKSIVVLSIILIFYYPKLILIWLVVIGGGLFFEKKIKNNMVYTKYAYILLIILLTSFGGINHLFGFSGNLSFYIALVILTIYYFVCDYDNKLLKFSLMFLLFNIVFSSGIEKFDFPIMILNTRSSVFLMMPLFICLILYKNKYILRLFTIGSLFYVALYLLVSTSNPATRNIFDYIEDYREFGSHRSVLIANKDVEELIKYPFELNADLMIYNYDGPDRLDRYEDSLIQTINKYIGSVNIYFDNNNFCVGKKECYVLLYKFKTNEYGNSRLMNLSDYLLETDKYYLFKFDNQDKVNEFIKGVDNEKNIY